MSDIPPDPSTEYSPYPRNQPGSMTARPARVSLDCISEAIQLVKQDAGMWVVATIVSWAIGYAVQLAVSMGISMIVGPQPTFEIAVTVILVSVVVSVLSGTVSYLFFAGMVQMALAKLDGGSVDISQLFTGFGRFPHMLVGVAISTVAIYLGMFLLIVPGVFVAGALAFVPVLVVRQNLSGIEAIAKSWEVLKPHAFSMFGFMIVLGLLLVAGLLACGVGVLFAYPVTCAAMAIQYRAFFPESVPEASHAIGMEPPKPQW